MKRAETTFLVGNNVDKGLMDKIRNHISHDKDIRRLIRSGRHQVVMNILILLIAALFLFIDIHDLTTTDIKGMFKPTLNTILGLISIIALIHSLIGLIDDCKELTKDAFTFKGAVCFLFSRNRPKHPLDMWHFYQGSVADIQMYHTYQGFAMPEENSSEVQGALRDSRVMYTGDPYYKTVYLDSIAIRWDKYPDKKFDSIFHWLNWHHFQQVFASRTLLSYANREFFKENNKHIESSNAVFGILFTSQYLNSEITRQNTGKKIRARVNLDQSVLSDKEKIRGKGAVCHSLRQYSRVAEEWLRYCLSPSMTESITNLNVNGEDSLDNNTDVESNRRDASDNSNDRIPGFTVIDIRTDKNLEKHRTHYHDPLVEWIPVKRFIALPESNPDDSKKDDSADTETQFGLPWQVLSHQHAAHPQTIISIGGAEQNMALQCMINYYRWHRNGRLHGPDIGFAENIFDELSGVNSFCVGTEGLVYGVRSTLIGRLVSSDENEKAKQSCRAEVFRIPLKDDIQVICVYGYSAMATKFALCQLLYSLEHESDPDIGKNVRKYLPGCVSIPDEIIDYEVQNNQGERIFRTASGKMMDREDLMNESDKLEEWLENANQNGQIFTRSDLHK